MSQVGTHTNRYQGFIKIHSALNESTPLPARKDPQVFLTGSTTDYCPGTNRKVERITILKRTLLLLFHAAESNVPG
jgi:hypothetical protein